MHFCFFSFEFSWRLSRVWPLWLMAMFRSRFFELPSNCESRFSGRRSVKVMNLKPLTSHWALYGTAWSPEASRRLHNRTIKKCVLSLCVCWVTEMWFGGDHLIAGELLTCSFHLLLPVAMEMIISHNWHIPLSSYLIQQPRFLTV